METSRVYRSVIGVSKAQKSPRPLIISDEQAILTEK